MSEQQRVTPSTGTFYTSLPVLDWGTDGRLVHPPEEVVQVSVINDLTCLTVCKYDEDRGKATSTTVTEVVVDTRALLSALVSQLDTDVADAALLLRHGAAR